MNEAKRSDVTAMLSDNLERFILQRFPIYGAEVKLNDGDMFAGCGGYGRVDYMAFEPLNMLKSVRSVEAGVVHVFEVKSCMADLKSGHGMNRVGDVNWLICTSDLWEEIIEKQVDVSGWKPMVYGQIKEGAFNPPTPWSYERYEITGRKMPASQAIWMILFASARRWIKS